MWERGVRVEHGFKVAVRDGGSGLGEALNYVYGSSVADRRCIFHKLKNVGDGCRSEPETSLKKELMGQAKGIYEAGSAKRIRELLAEWVEKWCNLEPKAVASLERDFESTLLLLQPRRRGRQAGSHNLATRANQPITPA